MFTCLYFQVHLKKKKCFGCHSKKQKTHRFKSFVFSKFYFLLAYWQLKSESTHLCPRIESDLLTNDAVEHLSQFFKVFQNEDVLLTTFL